jgi:hypothetical protein
MILFVGDKPSKKMKPGAKAFEGADCEERLNIWIKYLMGQSRLEIILERDVYGFYLINRTDSIFEYIAGNRIYAKITIALGNEASKALTKLGTPHFKLPHPSGRNRQINDKAYIQSRLEAAKIYIDRFKKI